MRALLLHGDTLYHAESDGSEAHRSAVATLVRGIWRVRPDDAIGILRNRIFTDGVLSAVCEGVIKVAGKRSSVLTPGEWDLRFSSFSGRRECLVPRLPDFQTHTIAAVGKGVEQELSRLRESAEGRPAVSAMLLDPDGGFLLGSWNMTARDRTSHAEVNLVEAWFATHSGPPPRGSSLHVSLRPCAMCAAQILALAGDPASLKVTYHEEDPGPASKNSCLVPGSDLWKKAGSPAWRAWPARHQEV